MNPILIAGGLLVGLPVLIHFILKQEPKRVPFPALRFLQAKQRTTSRQLKLRHFVLLALRMLLIALLAAALFQPKLPADASGRLGALSFGEGQPVAAVLIVDTSPSMGYRADGRTRLEEATRRAVELLDRLPGTSRVALLTTAEPFAAWEATPADARRRLEALGPPAGFGLPVTSVLPNAYQLFAALDADAGSTGGEPLPRLIAVFTDRTAAAWQADRVPDLVAAVEKLPAPKPATLVFDVGVDAPANVSLLAAEAKPAVAPAGSAVTVAVTARATGPAVPASRVRCVVTDTGATESKDVALPAGVPTPTTFTFRDLKPGLHQAEVTLETPDNLGPDGVPGFDNVRYVTFRVGEARKILTVSDDVTDAAFWQLAHRQTGEFACDVTTPAAAPDFAGYDVVCFLSVADPAKPLADGRSLWDRARVTVDRGGRLLVAPPGLETIKLAAYDPNGPAAGLMPGKLTTVVQTADLPAPPKDATDPDRRLGVNWYLGDEALGHPLMAPFKAWKLAGNVDFLRNPRRAWKFWEVDAAPDNVVARYDDSPDPAKRRPAVLEKTTPAGGKVLLLTTRIDSPWDEDRRWNDYYATTESSWNVVFPNLLAKYLAGDAAPPVFQFTAGRAVTLPLPKGADAAKPLILEGPGVSADDAAVKLAPDQSDFRLPPARAGTPGNYALRTADRSFAEGFSLNVPAEESDLGKVEPAAVESLTGPNSILDAGKNFDLTALLAGRATDVPLMPWLVLAVLALFAGEGVFANRFYRLGRAKRG
jgi:hypothetical protein